MPLRLPPNQIASPRLDRGVQGDMAMHRRVALDPAIKPRDAKIRSKSAFAAIWPATNYPPDFLPNVPLGPYMSGSLCLAEKPHAAAYR